MVVLRGGELNCNGEARLGSNPRAKNIVPSPFPLHHAHARCRSLGSLAKRCSGREVVDTYVIFSKAGAVVRWSEAPS